MTSRNPSPVPSWRADAPAGVTLAQAQITHAVAPPMNIANQAGGMAVALRRIIRPDARAQWTGWLAKDYTPERVEMVLRNALWGDHEAQWELFALMEDTWPRLRKAMLELKRAVVQMDWKVEPWAEDGEAPSELAETKAKVVSHALWRMRPHQGEVANGFQGTVFDLMDAWAKGISVLEIEWEVRAAGKLGAVTAPRSTTWVHPKHYTVGPDGTLLLRAGDSLAGGGLGRDQAVMFPPNKFLIAVCRSATGPLMGSALLRPLAWWWCSANFSASWLLNLAQVFGLPIRWATYAQGASEELIASICDMLENMGSSAWGAFPAGTSIDLKEPAKGGGQWPQDSLLDRADRQVDLLILGQTLTTDVGSTGSLALGGVHKSVRDEIIQGAADWVATIIDEQLVPAICLLNWGTDDERPEVCPKPSEVADLKAYADRDAVLMDRQVPLPKEWFYQRHQIPIPKQGEEVILKAPTPAPGFSDPGTGGAAAPDEDPEDPAPVDEGAKAEDATMQAANSEHRRREAFIQEVAATALAAGVGARRSWLAPLNEELRRLAVVAADPKRSDAEVIKLIAAGKDRLPELFTDLDTSAVAKHLTAVLGAAARGGAVEGLKR